MDKVKKILIGIFYPFFTFICTSGFVALGIWGIVRTSTLSGWLSVLNTLACSLLIIFGTMFIYAFGDGVYSKGKDE